MPRPRSLLIVLSLLLSLYLSSACGGTSADGARLQADLQKVLARFEAGQAREGLSALLGQSIDDPTWQRTRQLYISTHNRAARSAADSCARNLVFLAQAIELYRADETHLNVLPDRLSDVLAAVDWRSMPTCPAAGTDSYSAGYKRLGTNSYQLVCSGHQHAAAGLAVNQPAFDARWGLLRESDSSAAWWPEAYRLELVSVDCGRRQASVTFQERGRQLSLAMRREASGWQLPAQPVDDASSLGGLISAYQAAVGHPPSMSSDQTARVLGRVSTALEMYSCDHGGAYPPSLGELVPRYLRELPSYAVYQVAPDRCHFELTSTGNGTLVSVE